MAERQADRIFLATTATYGMLIIMNYEAFVDYFNAHDLCSYNMGIRLLSVGEGCAEAEMPLTDLTRNIMGGLHGGALATLADIVAGCSMVHHGRTCVTLDTSIRYLKGVRAGSVRAVAKEIHGGKRTGVTLINIFDEEGQLCCTCTTTMYLLDKPMYFDF